MVEQLGGVLPQHGSMFCPSMDQNAEGVGKFQPEVGAPATTLGTSIKNKN